MYAGKVEGIAFVITDNDASADTKVRIANEGLAALCDCWEEKVKDVIPMFKPDPDSLEVLAVFCPHVRATLKSVSLLLTPVLNAGCSQERLAQWVQVTERMA